MSGTRNCRLARTTNSSPGFPASAEGGQHAACRAARSPASSGNGEKLSRMADSRTIWASLLILIAAQYRIRRPGSSLLCDAGGRRLAAVPSARPKSGGFARFPAGLVGCGQYRQGDRQGDRQGVVKGVSRSVQRPRRLQSILSACGERPGDERIGAEFLEPQPVGPFPLTLARHFRQGRPRDGYRRDGKATIPSIALFGDVEHSGCDQKRRARQVGRQHVAVVERVVPGLPQGPEGGSMSPVRVTLQQFQLMDTVGTAATASWIVHNAARLCLSTALRVGAPLIGSDPRCCTAIAGAVPGFALPGVRAPASIVWGHRQARPDPRVGACLLCELGSTALRGALACVAARRAVGACRPINPLRWR